jgi:ribA/ribD-fused uncharacterized protein
MCGRVRLMWRGVDFDTSEHAYHWAKFVPGGRHTPIEDVLCSDMKLANARVAIVTAHSAHDAFKFAETNKHLVRKDWPDIRVDVMHDILRAKAEQHEYVRRKLLETGDRELVEDSWRDSFWGWGPKKNGKNMLGRLWMEVRTELWTQIRDELGGKPCPSTG